MGVRGRSSDATMRRVRSSKRVCYGRPIAMLAGRQIDPFGAHNRHASKLRALGHMSHPIAGQQTLSSGRKMVLCSTCPLPHLEMYCNVYENVL